MPFMQWTARGNSRSIIILERELKKAGYICAYPEVQGVTNPRTDEDNIIIVDMNFYRDSDVPVYPLDVIAHMKDVDIQLRKDFRCYSVDIITSGFNAKYLINLFRPFDELRTSTAMIYGHIQSPGMVEDYQTANIFTVDFERWELVAALIPPDIELELRFTWNAFELW